MAIAIRNHALPLSAPTLEELTGVFGRNHGLVIIFACDAESGLDQLTISGNLKKLPSARVPARRPSSFAGSSTLAIPALPDCTRVLADEKKGVEGLAFAHSSCLVNES